jgi:RNA polymerase sigma-B factor
MSGVKTDRERELFVRAQAGDPDARSALVDQYLPLARSLALRFRGRTEPMDDLFQVASIGLVIAIGRFDTERGLAFSTYAVPTILGELRRHFRDRTWSVRVPRSLQERAIAVTQHTEQLSAKLNRPPTVAELCEAMGLEKEEVLEALHAGQAYTASSLDGPSNRGGTDDDATLGERLGYSDDGFEAAETRALLKSASAELTLRQRRILQLHLEDDLTQEQIARTVGVSQMQVSRDLESARRALKLRLVA